MYTIYTRLSRHNFFSMLIATQKRVEKGRCGPNVQSRIE
jgi:hypothetical protein